MKRQMAKGRIKANSFIIFEELTPNRGEETQLWAHRNALKIAKLNLTTFLFQPNH